MEREKEEKIEETSKEEKKVRKEIGFGIGLVVQIALLAVFLWRVYPVWLRVVVTMFVITLDVYIYFKEWFERTIISIKLKPTFEIRIGDKE